MDHLNVPFWFKHQLKEEGDKNSSDGNSVTGSHSIKGNAKLVSLVIYMI